MKPNIIFTFPRWEVSGVTAVNLDLAAALRDLGADCMFAVDNENHAACPYELPSGIPCHGLSGQAGLERFIPSNTIKAGIRLKRSQTRLRQLISKANGPVVLIPGYAFALTTPVEPWGNRTGMLGVIHADDEVNIGFALGQGRNWIRCVCVSNRVARCVKESAPWLDPVVVPNGVPCNSQPPPLRIHDSGRPLRIVSAGRLEQKQKRIFDLVELIGMTGHLPIHWEIAGEGPDGAVLRERLEGRIQAGTVTWHGAIRRTAVRDLFRRADLMIMTSVFEGMPMGLLEAMSEGCVPLVSEGCDAGADLVRGSKAGFVLPTGGLEQFVQTLEMLVRDRERLPILSRGAWSAIKNGPNNAGAMGAAYYSIIMEWIGNRR